MKAIRLLVSLLSVEIAVGVLLASGVLLYSLTVAPVIADAANSEQTIQKSIALNAIHKQMQSLVGFLDSQTYASQISWNEHIVMVYQLAARRDPSLPEFFNILKLQDQIALKRSTVLALALRGEGLGADWEHCRRFMERIDISDFSVSTRVKESAQRLAAAPLKQVLEEIRNKSESRSLKSQKPLQTSLELPESGTQYQTYFGLLHAHTELSDGEGSPQEAYSYARDVGDLDFFAVSDHGENLNSWPWEDDWDNLKDAANEAYIPGEYTTLWGFEWSSPIYGHITVLNTDDFTDSIFTNSIERIYDWIGNRPASFGHFNHPGEYDDFDSEFSHLQFQPQAAAQLVGIEMLNGNDDFDSYYYGGSWSSNDSYWDEGNKKGWILGALGNQDNHDRDWGTKNQFRTAVLAESLTRESIITAYKQRRFYATEDKDLHLDFRCQGYPMGSRLSAAIPSFEITAWDGSGDHFQEVRLYRNGELINTKNVSGNDVKVSIDDRSSDGSPAYYYVIVRQTDDNDGSGRPDEAVSSPIWINVTSPFPVNIMPWIPLLLFE